MAFTTPKLTDMPLRSSLSFSSYSYSYYYSYPSSLNLFFSAPKPFFRFFTAFSSLRSPYNPSSNSSRYSNPWDRQSSVPHNSGASSSLQASPSSTEKFIRSDGNDINTNVEMRHFDKQRGQSSIERIVLRLRNLGLGSDEEDEEEDGADGYNSTPVTGEERLGDLLKREWVRPDTMLIARKKEEALLPWEREEAEVDVIEEGGLGLKKRRVKAPTLAELTIEDGELRRLRRMGMYLRERINVPKAGITQAVLEKIHDKWRKEELVRLKFHEVLATDMKTAHEIVEVGGCSSHWIC